MPQEPSSLFCLQLFKSFGIINISFIFDIIHILSVLSSDDVEVEEMAEVDELGNTFDFTTEEDPISTESTPKSTIPTSTQSGVGHVTASCGLLASTLLIIPLINILT